MCCLRACGSLETLWGCSFFIKELPLLYPEMSKSLAKRRAAFWGASCNLLCRKERLGELQAVGASSVLTYGLDADGFSCSWFALGYELFSVCCEALSPLMTCGADVDLTCCGGPSSATCVGFVLSVCVQSCEMGLVRNLPGSASNAVLCQHCLQKQNPVPRRCREDKLRVPERSTAKPSNTNPGQGPPIPAGIPHSVGPPGPSWPHPTYFGLPCCRGRLDGDGCPGKTKPNHGFKPSLPANISISHLLL